MTTCGTCRCGGTPCPTTCAGRSARRSPGTPTADVAIVGAGYTGLWTAYYLLPRRPVAEGRDPRSRAGGLRCLRPQRRLGVVAVSRQPRGARAAVIPRRGDPAQAGDVRDRRRDRPGRPSTRAGTSTGARAARSSRPVLHCSSRLPRGDRRPAERGGSAPRTTPCSTRPRPRSACGPRTSSAARTPRTAPPCIRHDSCAIWRAPSCSPAPACTRNAAWTPSSRASSAPSMATSEPTSSCGPPRATPARSRATRGRWPRCTR